MSDQIRSILIIFLISMFMVVFFLSVLNANIVATIALGVLGFLIGYNWGLLDKFDI
jgi:hypothetical protein